MMDRLSAGWKSLSTEDVSPHESLDYWHHATNALFPPTRVARASHQGFYGRLSWLEFGDVTLADITSTSLDVSRTREQIAEGDQWYEVNLQIEGTSIFDQGGRSVVSSPRTMVVYDSCQPYRMQFDGHYRQLSLKVPRNMLRDRVPGIDVLTSRQISAETLPGRFLFDFAMTLCEMRQDATSQQLFSRIESHAVELLATALLGVTETAPLSASRQAQLGRIKSFILSHLDDPALSPAEIVRTQQVSLRSLYELFEAEEQQVAQWIKLKRLERIRSDLDDPLLRGWPITTIALRRGFKDFSHFSRAFRSQFGISPRDYRNRQIH